MYKGLEILKNILNGEKHKTIKVIDELGLELEMNIDMKSEAQEHEINGILYLNLPKTYIDFLKEYNGGRLFDLQGIDGFEFFGTNNILSINNSIKEEYQDDWLDNIIIFAECIGEGNYLGFKTISINEYEIIDCFHEEIPINWNSIGNSFELFLEELISVNGKKFYL